MLPCPSWPCHLLHVPLHHKSGNPQAAASAEICGAALCIYSSVSSLCSLLEVDRHAVKLCSPLASGVCLLPRAGLRLLQAHSILLSQAHFPCSYPWWSRALGSIDAGYPLLLRAARCCLLVSCMPLVLSHTPCPGQDGWASLCCLLVTLLPNKASTGLPARAYFQRHNCSSGIAAPGSFRGALSSHMCPLSAAVDLDTQVKSSHILPSGVYESVLGACSSALCPQS